MDEYELDFNKIRINYIKKTIIYAIFLYKPFRFNQNEYRNLVNRFVKKRCFLTIDLNLSVIPDIGLDEENKIELYRMVDTEMKNGYTTALVWYDLLPIDLSIDLTNYNKYLDFLKN